jgi:hypothetical protein
MSQLRVCDLVSSNGLVLISKNKLSLLSLVTTIWISTSMYHGDYNASADSRKGPCEKEA